MYFIDPKTKNAYGGDRQGSLMGDAWVLDPLAPTRPDNTAWDVPSQTWKPIQAPLQDQLDAVFMTLSDAFRAQFYPFKAAFKVALEQDDLKALVLMAQNLTVPPELQADKDQILAILKGAEGGN